MVAVALFLFGIAACFRHATLYEGEDPFDISFVRGARWQEGRLGFDPELPGYHFDGGIGKVSVRPRAETFPAEIVFSLRTSPGMEPHLEGFIAESGGLVYRASPSAKDDRVEIMQTDSAGRLASSRFTALGAYFAFEAVGSSFHVRFGPEGMALLRAGCAISWVDWYR